MPPKNAARIQRSLGVAAKPFQYAGLARVPPKPNRPRRFSHCIAEPCADILDQDGTGIDALRGNRPTRRTQQRGCDLRFQRLLGQSVLLEVAMGTPLLAPDSQ